MFQGSLLGVFTLDNIRIETSNSIAKSETTTSQDQIRLYPNPVQDQLNITIPTDISKNEYGYNIVDTTGKMVLQGGSKQNTLTVNTSPLPKGIYFIRVKSTAGLHTKKFIKK